MFRGPIRRSRVFFSVAFAARMVAPLFRAPNALSTQSLVHARQAGLARRRLHFVRCHSPIATRKDNLENTIAIAQAFGVTPDDLEQYDRVSGMDFNVSAYLGSVQCEDDADLLPYLAANPPQLGHMYELYMKSEDGKALYWPHMECLFRLSRLLHTIIDAEPPTRAFRQHIHNQMMERCYEPRRPKQPE